MTDDTTTYRVRTDQSGRTDKPVLHADGSQTSPGDTFEGPPSLVDAMGDRVTVADSDEAAVWSKDEDGDHRLDRGDDDPEATAATSEDSGESDGDGDGDGDGDEDATDESAAEDTAASEDDTDGNGDTDGDGDGDGDEDADADADSDESDASNGAVNQQELVDDLGYDDLSVTELREELADRDLSEREERALLNYEKRNEDRKTAKEAITES